MSTASTYCWYCSIPTSGENVYCDKCDCAVTLLKKRLDSVDGRDPCARDERPPCEICKGHPRARGGVACVWCTQAGLDLNPARVREADSLHAALVAHITNYTIPKYGDKGADPDPSIAGCCDAAIKYLTRIRDGKTHPGETPQLDALKAAHYIAMLFAQLPTPT